MRVDLLRITGLTAVAGLLFATGAVSALASYFSSTAVSSCTNSGYGYQSGYGYGYMVTCSTTTTTSGGGGGGGSVFSTTTTNNTTANDATGTQAAIISAYEFGYKNGLTTLPLKKAKLGDVLNRQELAKMAVAFVKNVKGGAVAADSKNCDITKYTDYKKLSTEMKGYVQEACDLGIMGRKGNKDGLISAFRPFDSVTRAEFGTVLSRILFGETNNKEGDEWYKGHLSALKKAGIMTKTNTPFAYELRQWALLMFQRAANM